MAIMTREVRLYNANILVGVRRADLCFSIQLKHPQLYIDYVENEISKIMKKIREEIDAY